MENRAELRGSAVGWLGCASHTPHIQAVATSAWTLLQVLSALGSPFLEEGL